MLFQIYISNLSPTITAEKLFQFFGEATESKVLHVRMHTDATPISKILSGVALFKLFEVAAVVAFPSIFRH